MKKYIGGLFALLTSLTMVSAYAECCGGCGKGKVMGSVANAPAPVVSKTAPATPAPAAQAANTAPVAKAPVIASKDAKDKAVAAAPQDNVAEDDSEDDE
jgi:hypothetical protein